MEFYRGRYASWLTVLDVSRFSCDTSYDEEDWTNLQTYLAKDEILRILQYVTMSCC